MVQCRVLRVRRFPHLVDTTRGPVVCTVVSLSTASSYSDPFSVCPSAHEWRGTRDVRFEHRSTKKREEKGELLILKEIDPIFANRRQGNVCVGVPEVLVGDVFRTD